MSGPPVNGPRVILGIETSCDETAAAVVEAGRRVRSNVVSSQVTLHAPYGGVVPEVAGRAHESLIAPVVDEAISKAGIERPDAVAVTRGPGLMGSLLIGVAAAKAYALAWDVPFIGVNHHEAHLYAPFIEADDPAVASADDEASAIEFPVVVLLVSGGHTMLINFRGHGDYALLGATLDDAAGEAFDKVARYLGLGFPGGPAIQSIAERGNPGAVKLPRPMLGDGFDFSFSGLKTAVVTAVRKQPTLASEDVAASFQEAVVDVLTTKALRAADEVDATGVVLAGGVAANTPLRERVSRACDEAGIAAHLPSRAMCTDNAAMVASVAWWRLASDGPHSLALGADPSLKIAFA